MKRPVDADVIRNLRKLAADLTLESAATWNDLQPVDGCVDGAQIISQLRAAHKMTGEMLHLAYWHMVAPEDKDIFSALKEIAKEEGMAPLEYMGKLCGDSPMSPGIRAAVEAMTNE